MRQGRPWVIYAVDCRRGCHGRCLHNTENFTSHCRYFVYCACDCHPRNDQDPDELRELRRALARSGEISGCFNPSLPLLWTHDDGAAPAGGRRRMNPLAELVELAAPPATLITPTQVGRRPATSVAFCGPGVATSITPAVGEPSLRVHDAKHMREGNNSMRKNTRISKALTCSGCDEKRQVTEWMSDRLYYGGSVTMWRLCAVCLLDALRLLLTKNITRQKPEKEEETDGTKTAASDGAITPVHRAGTLKAVRRRKNTAAVRRPHQRRGRLPNKRRRAKH